VAGVGGVVVWWSSFCCLVFLVVVVNAFGGLGVVGVAGGGVGIAVVS